MLQGRLEDCHVTSPQGLVVLACYGAVKAIIRIFPEHSKMLPYALVCFEFLDVTAQMLFFCGRVRLAAHV